MITQKDIEALTKYQKEVFKDVFFTKEDGKKIESKIDKIQITADTLVKDAKDLKDDKLIMNHRMKKVEDWVDKASPKLGLKFEH